MADRAGLPKYVRKGADRLIVRVPGYPERTFRLNKFDSWAATEAAAKAYLKKLLGSKPAVAAPPAARPPREGNATGHSGVREKMIRGKRYYVAERAVAPNKTVRQVFSIEKYGEAEALHLAIKARLRGTPT